MKLFIAIIFIIITTPMLSAQAKADFRSRNFIGLLEGEAGSSWQLQTINGFRRGSWFAGLGTGLDFYRYRTVPLFLSINKDVDSGSNSFYLTGDVGINFSWVSKQARSRVNDYISDKFTPSLYWNAGFGYRIMMFKKGDALLINLAYSYKHLKETKQSAIVCVTTPCPDGIEEYNYHFKRLSIGLGWEF
ncbi:MAG: hypothetical protein JJE22_18085 [Bacteroidia bacterium]|nr:hypothetical protein [Bacteroidia bacterium]